MVPARSWGHSPLGDHGFQMRSGSGAALVPVCPRSYYISWIWAIVQGNLSSPECNNDCPVTLKCHLKIAQDQPTNTVKQSQTVQIKLASKSNQENPPFYPYHCLQRFVAFDSSLEDYQIWKCELFLTSLASRAGCYLSVFILFWFTVLLPPRTSSLALNGYNHIFSFVAFILLWLWTVKWVLCFAPETAVFQLMKQFVSAHFSLFIFQRCCKVINC